MEVDNIKPKRPLCWMSNPREYPKAALSTTNGIQHKGKVLTRSDFKPYLPPDCIHLIAYYINSPHIIYLSSDDTNNIIIPSNYYRSRDLKRF